MPEQRGYLLVVEDDDALRDLYTIALEDYGHVVDSVASAEEAITVLERCRPDVVITDIAMRGMSGIDLIRHLSDGYPPPAPPIIAVSGFQAAEDEALAAGASRFLNKPIDLQELLDVVHAELSGERFEEQDYDSRRRRRRNGARAMAEASISVALQHDPELERRAVTVVKWVAHYIGNASVLLLVPVGNQIRVMAASDAVHFLPGTASEGLAALGSDVVETGSTLVLPDCKSIGVPLSLAGCDICAVVGVPFCVQEAVVGALCLVAPEPRGFGSCEVALLEHLAERASDWTLGRRRRPFLSPGGLISRSSFEFLLRLESEEAARKSGQRISLTVLRLGSGLDRGSGVEILETCPERRTLIGELTHRKLAVAIRGESDEVRSISQRVTACLRARASIDASARILVGQPLPSAFDGALLDWASELLLESEHGPPGTALTIDAIPRLVPANAAT